MNELCWYNKSCSLECDCDEHCHTYMKMKYLMENSNLPKSKQKIQVLYVPEEDEQSYEYLSYLKSNILDFVNNGENLYIGSDTPGNGKTTWSIKLMHGYFHNICETTGFRPRALFIPVTWFLLKCKDFGNKDPEFEEIKKLILEVDLVVWDDISAVSMSQYDYSQFYSILDFRLLSEKSNIFNGNYTTIREMQSAMDDRLASRIWNSSKRVIFKSEDNREL